MAPRRPSTAPPRRISAAGAVLALALSAGISLTGPMQDSQAAVVSPVAIDAGGAGYTTSSGTAFVSDRGFSGGTVYQARPSTRIANTQDAALYRSTRTGMSGYRLPAPTPGRYRVELYLVELQTGGSGKRVFDVSAEGADALRELDVFKQYGRATAAMTSFEVTVTDGTLDLGFRSRSSLPPAIAALRVVSLTATPIPATAPSRPPAATSAPTVPAGPAGSTAPTRPTVPPGPAARPPAPPAPPAASPPPPSTRPLPAPPPPAPAVPAARPSGEFPTVASTGPRMPLSSLVASGAVSSGYDGQVIAGRDITGNVRISHDNVTVRDSRISFTGTHGLTVVAKPDGSCPVGTRFEHVDVDGRLAAENDIPVYSSGCGWTLDHAYVHNVGRTSRLTNDNTVSNSYIHSNRTGGSGAHRGAVGTNGGRNNRIINNVLLCEGKGCSAAIPMYGDFAPVDGMLVQHNLMATTGSYCAYGGSLSGKPYPSGTNVKFIDNHFSTRFSPRCGQYGHISGFAGGVRGNEWRGNVWHESGRGA